MQNQYGLPLTQDSTQTMIPVMFDSGEMIGFVSIASTAFDGTETEFEMPDLSMIPIQSVTVAEDPTRPGRPLQYMASVYSINTAKNFKPWASQYLREPAEGFLRSYSLATMSWMLRQQASILQAALDSGFGGTVPALPTPTPPTVSTPQPIRWKASVAYSALFGDCPFFDFNWVTLFSASSTSKALTITSTSNPAPIAPMTQPPMVSQIVGYPEAIAPGIQRYNTVRIMKLQDAVPAATYAFGFNVTTDNGTVVPVVLNLTVE